MRSTASPRRLEARRWRCRHVVEQADAADGGRRQDAAAVGLVVERDVARHDGEVERPAGLADAADAADELAHGLRPLRIAEIEVVGDGERQAADGGDVAPGLGHRLLAALDGVGLAIARRDVGGEGEALRPVEHAHDARRRRPAAARCCRGSGGRTAPRPSAWSRDPASRRGAAAPRRSRPARARCRAR